MTFRRDIAGEAEVRAGVAALAAEVAARLRRKHLKCTVVQVHIKDPNFRTVQRQCTLKKATWLQKDLVKEAMALIGAARGFGAPIRTLTITAAGLVPPEETAEQLDLFTPADDAPDKQENVEETMAEIRRRFGADSIRLGVFENPEIGTGLSDDK